MNGQFSDAVSDDGRELEDSDTVLLEEDQEWDSAEEDEGFELNDEWDATGGDFTKKYNRMKSQMETLTNAGSAPVKGQILSTLEKNRRLKHESSTKGKKDSANAAVPPALEPDVGPARLPTLSERDMLDLTEKFASRIKLNDVFTGGQSSGRKADDGKYLTKDKADRATVEQVLDPRYTSDP
ncbi:hypothetical protein HDU91_004384 [Kappamyces sp. JEL0680]|nr:hypothetical protein HDU91_004384 [Kappamyces sp. JEL0680]